MKTHVINHLGTAAIKRYDLPFDPAFAFIVPLHVQMPSIHAEEMWGARTTPIGAAESFTHGCRFIDRQLLISTDTKVNDSGKAYKIVVVGLDDADIPVASWCGNATAGRVVDLDKAIRPVAAIVKRDNTLPAVVKITGGTTAAMDGTAVTDCISLTDGSLTLTAADHVNQWVPATGVGEGLCGLAFTSANSVTGTYTGTGAGTSLSLGADCDLAFIWRTDGTQVAFIAVRGANIVKACDASTAIDSTVALMGGRLAFGGAALNATGVSYSYLGIKRAQVPARENRAPAAIVRGKRAMFNQGRGTVGYVDFGTGLNLSGAMSITWTGAVPGEVYSADLFDAPLLLKAAATNGSTTAGVASWGLIAVSRIDDDAHGWCGPHVVGVATGRVSHIKPLTTSTWRTGVIAPAGFHHHALVHRGGGRWDYYLDGVLRKQRAESTDSVVSNVAHRITMGARWNGSGYSHNSRMTALGASVYSRALTSDEVRILAEHDLHGSSQDVTSGLAERWTGSGLSGTTWAATVDPANNGTLTGGAIAVDL